MFPFWNFRDRFLAKLDTGKPVLEMVNFGHSLVSFRPGNLRISRFLKLTSGGWNSWLRQEWLIFSRCLVSFRPTFQSRPLKLTRVG